MTFRNHLTNFVLGTSPLGGAFGSDWFYLSRSFSTFIAIGTVSNITTSTIIICLATLKTIAVEGEAAVPGFADTDHCRLDLHHDCCHAYFQVIKAKYLVNETFLTFLHSDPVAGLHHDEMHHRGKMTQFGARKMIDKSWFLST